MIRQWLIFLLVHGCLLAQDSLQLENLLEALTDGADQQYDMVLVLRNLEEHPVILNRASLPELLRLPFLSEKQARALLAYRKQHGPFQHLDALVQIPGFSPELVAFLRPYVRLNAPRKPWQMEYQLTSATATRWWQGRGPNTWPEALYASQKFSFRYGEGLRFIVLTEKDGEEPRWADFAGGAVKWLSPGGRWMGIVGDYTLSFGQGLVQNRAYGIPASLYGRAVFHRRFIRLQEKFSFNEWAYLRGGAVAARFTEQWAAGVFTSWRRYDARLEGDSVVTTLYRTGYHRGERESQRRNQLGEMLAGFWHSVTGEFWQMGLLVRARRFSRMVQQNTLRVPPNTWIWHTALAMNVEQGGFRFSAEAAWQNQEAAAWQVALQVRLNRWRLGMAGFWYGKQFFSLQGRQLGSFSAWAMNRKGLYGYLEGPLQTRVALTLFWWVNQKLWDAGSSALPLKFRSQFQLTYRWNRTDRLYLRGGYSTDDEYAIAPSPVWFARLQWELRQVKPLRFTTRLQWVFSSLPAKTSGFVGFQDVRIRSGAFWLGTRWTVFDIPDALPGVYLVEPDLRGYVRSVYFNRRGYRWTVLVNFPFASFLVFQVKYAIHILPTLSDGSAPYSARNRELRIQLRFRR